MDLALTDEQTMIRDAAADVLAERSASADVRRALEQSAGRDDTLWAALAATLAGTRSRCRRRWAGSGSARSSRRC